MKTVYQICTELQQEIPKRKWAWIPRPIRIVRNELINADMHLPANSINILQKEKEELYRIYLDKCIVLDQVINKLRENQ